MCVCVVVRACMSVTQSQVHRWTLANWEGRICFYFDLVVRAIRLLFGLWICETERLEEKVMVFSQVLFEEFAM